MRKIVRKPPTGYLHSLPILGPFETVVMYILVPFRRTPDGNVYVWVVTDFLTNFTIASPSPDKSANLVAKFYVKKVVMEHGAPKCILTDMGTLFRSELVLYISSTCGEKQIRTTVYHPEINGQVERRMGLLTECLAMYVDDDHDNWDEYLKFVVTAHNAAVYFVTGDSQFFLYHGREYTVPVDIVIGTLKSPSFDSLLEYVQFFTAAFASAHDIARARIGTIVDEQRRNLGFSVGDLVKVSEYANRPGKTNKLCQEYSGPWSYYAKFLMTSSSSNF